MKLCAILSMNTSCWMPRDVRDMRAGLAYLTPYYLGCFNDTFAHVRPGAGSGFQSETVASSSLAVRSLTTRGSLVVERAAHNGKVVGSIPTSATRV